MRLILLLLLLGTFGIHSVYSGNTKKSFCKMKPPPQIITLPDSGFQWSTGMHQNEPCHRIPADGWNVGISGSFKLYVYADGPAGSGRFWTVVIGVSDQNKSTPERGICLSTWTVGWRTLQRYSKGALPWLKDIDGDGIAEVLLWDSFPLTADSTTLSLASYALIAWIYRLKSSDSLIIDWNLTRKFAFSIADEYRAPLKTRSSYPGALRSIAADELEKFARQECIVKEKTR